MLFLRQVLMSDGMKTAVALTALLGLLAIAAGVFVALDQYRNLNSVAGYHDRFGPVEACFLVGLALLVGSIGLVKAQNWARIQVAVCATLFAGSMAILAPLAIAYARGMTRVLFPLLAVPGGLVCLWLVYYVLVGGRAPFPTLGSRSSVFGCAVWAGSLLALPVLLFGWAAGVILWNLSSATPPLPPLPARSAVEERLDRTLRQVPTIEHVEPIRCPDATIEKATPPTMKFRDYLGEVVFVEPVLRYAARPAWQPVAGWEWMTAFRIRWLPKGEDWNLRFLGTLPYVAAIRALDADLPEPWAHADDAWRRGKGALLADVHFRPGRFRGAVFIMDVGHAQLVCQVPLEARSSRRIDDPGTLDLDARAAVTWDFKREIVRRSRDALSGISQVVRLDWGDAPSPERSAEPRSLAR